MFVLKELQEVIQKRKKIFFNISSSDLAYQEYCEFGKVNCLVSDILGSDLIGTALTAPNSLVYKTVYCLPMINVSTKKGTGIVTSVPSDSPGKIHIFISKLIFLSIFR